MSAQIPIIDLDAWFHGNEQQRHNLCARINKICHDIGFFYIINHGIPESISDEYLRMAKLFFDLPESQKQQLDKSHSPHFRGWEKLGSELTNNEYDYREQIDLGLDRAALPSPDPYYLSLIGPNQWPQEDSIPGFQKVVTDYIQRLSDVSRQLLRIMSLSLGLNEDHIEKTFGANPSPYTKLIRYPRTLPGGRGVGVHKDSGFLTLLLQDSQSGLEAQSNSGTWHSVDPIKGSLVVNTGELLQMVTHNYFIATPHRVTNTSNSTRYSSAFFYSPDLNTDLIPLPIDPVYIIKAASSSRHSTEGLMASKAELDSGKGGMESNFRPLKFGEKYWQRWVRSYPEIAKKYYPNHV
jgi:isopenicillin N synthase-like dioxygenase